MAEMVKLGIGKNSRGRVGSLVYLRMKPGPSGCLSTQASHIPSKERVCRAPNPPF